MQLLRFLLEGLEARATRRALEDLAADAGASLVAGAAEGGEDRATEANVTREGGEGGAVLADEGAVEAAVRGSALRTIDMMTPDTWLCCSSL